MRIVLRYFPFLQFPLLYLFSDRPSFPSFPSFPPFPSLHFNIIPLLILRSYYHSIHISIDTLIGWQFLAHYIYHTGGALFCVCGLASPPGRGSGWLRGVQPGWSDAVPGSGSSSAQLRLKSSSTSSQVPLTFRLHIYYSSTQLPGILFSLSAGQTCGWQPLMYCYRCTVCANTVDMRIFDVA